MIPFWSNGVSELHHADAREIPLPDGSVHCVVTSPPYYGLRDYGLAGWRGGDAACDHERRESIADAAYNAANPLPGGWRQNKGELPPVGVCGRCGAQQEEAGIGIEPTLAEHLEGIVAVFRELRRVLREDGTVFLNYGDAYAGGGRGEGDYRVDKGKQGTNAGTMGLPRESGSGLAAKQLMGLPWRVAFALQDDGWILRSAIVWSKPNPMPESVRDRPTSAHEMIFLLSKSNSPVYWTHRDGPGTRTRPEADYRWIDAATETEYSEEPLEVTDELIPCPPCRGVGEIVEESGQVDMFEGVPTLISPCLRCLSCSKCEDAEEHVGQVHRWRRINLWTSHDYFYDAEAIRTAAKDPQDDLRRIGQQANGNKSEPNAMQNGLRVREYTKGKGYREDGRRDDGRLNGARHAGFEEWDSWTKEEQQAGGANARNVWEIATQPRSDAHFATFPDELPRRCILAGTSHHGVCSQCGSPWERTIVKAASGRVRDRAKAGLGMIYSRESHAKSAVASADFREGVRYKTLGWAPTCDCGADPVPATVLDPFVGSGTTVEVAQRLGRHGVGLDLNAKYLEIAKKRIGG